MSNYFELQNGPILTTPSSITVPKISTIGYPGDDTAADPTGGQTITLTGNGFEAGASVIINGNAVGVVSVVNSTTITFTSPALSAGSYPIYVVNTDGGTAIAVPGIQYSGTPNWTTAAGSLGSYTETQAISNTVVATGDAPITYSLFSGTLPTGATLNSANGLISGTSPITASPTTYTFTIRATDAEQQDTNRTFSLTINPDVVTWSSPANGTTYTSVANSAISNVALNATAASGQNITYTANALPTGLSINGSNITGTPTVVANSSTLLTATAATTNATATRTINWVISVAGDPNFEYVTTLLSASTPTSTFVTDASTNAFAVTVNGDARPSNFGPYTPGYYGVTFDGSNYLSVPNNVAMNFMSSNYTVEAWIYPTGTPGATYGYGIFANTNGSDGWLLRLQSSMVLALVYPGVVSNSFGSAIPMGAWTHVAIVRNGTAVTGYINGVGYSITNTTPAETNRSWTIGFGYSDAFVGSISNLRVLKGTALYTSNFTPSTTPLTAIANTSLLTCQSSRFLDNSTNALTVTPTGTPAVTGLDPFLPDSNFLGRGSGYFDGTGDYLDVSSNAAFNISGGDFTIEAWIYPANVSGTKAIAGIFASGTGGWYLGLNGSTLRFSSGQAGGDYDAGTVLSSVWSHVAVTRSGNSMRMFINGTQVNTTTDISAQNFNVTNPLWIANINTAGWTFTGNISNFRLVKGTAVYTANFTPPTSPLTAIANTSLLTLQNNQPNNNSMFLDSSTNNFNITRNGNATQGSFSPYGGGWSNYFDGTGDYLTVPSSSQFAYGTGNFTWEFWIYPTSPVWTSGNQYILDHGSNGGSLAYQSNTLIYYNPTTGTSSSLYTVGTGAIPAFQWTHIAVVRLSGTTYMYKNGVLSTSASDSNNYGSQGVTIANYGGGGYTAQVYISNMRLVKGTAVYTSAFTPPATPLTAIANTSLLTCADNRFIDDSANNFAITRYGDTSIQRFNPFNPVLTAPTSYSGFFDGSGDYLTAPNNAAFAFGTGDFTIECWLYYIIGGSTDRFIVDSGNGANFLFRYGSGTTLQFYANGSLKLSYAVALQNAWSHIAVVRSGTAYTLYVNGTSVATGTGSENISNSTAIGIGAINTGASDYYSGYISNLRIVKGTAVYTGNFTPSTTPLTAITNTSLLTCQSPTFIDNSTNNFTITANGDTAPRQFNPFGWTSTTGSSAAYTPTLYGGSAYFDGTGDYLTAGTTSTWTFLHNASALFTIEAWIYVPSLASGGPNFGTNSGASAETGAAFWVNSSRQLRLLIGRGAPGSPVIDATSSGLVPTQSWVHVAVTYNQSLASNNCVFYINGVSAGTATKTSNTPTSSNSNFPFTINGYGTTAAPASYISDVRVLPIVAYTSNFAPPAAPLTALPNTTLLANMTGAGIYDSSMITTYETAGNAGISTSLKKYGNTSLYFDGTGDYLFTPTSPNLTFGTGDFTVEMWLRTGTTADQIIFDMRQGGGNGAYPTLYYTGGLLVWFVSSANRITSSAIAQNTWYHVAVSRSGTSTRMFLDGVQTGSTYTDSTNYLCDRLFIGASASGGGTVGFLGYLDDVRITKGVARYTANFTPPTTPFITN